MGYGLKIAWRHLVSNLSQTGLLTLGVAVAVFIFIFMSALIGGLADFMVQNTLGGLAHVTVTAEDRNLPLLDQGSEATVLLARQKSTRAQSGILEADQLLSVIMDIPGVATSSPQINGAGALIRAERVRQVTVTGVEPGNINAIVPFDSYLTQGTLTLAGTSVLIGATLAEDMNLALDSQVTLRTESGNTVTLQVSGIFFSGMGQLDSGSAYIDMATARSLFDSPNAISRIELKLTDLYQADHIAQRVTDTTGLAAEPWTATAQQLYDGLQAQANTGLILKAFALITIVIGVASSLMLSTYRRRPEIGIMRAMGATQSFILFVFVSQGFLIGLLGGVAGAVLGFAVLTPLTPVGGVQPGQLPIDVGQGSIGLAILLTTIGATLASILPARSASRIDPVEAIGQ